MSTQRFDFTGADGQQLSGILELPDGPVSSHVLFAHCFTCTKDSLAAVRLGRALTALGFGVLRFDFTGLGQSGGEFADSSFSGNVADVVAAADAMRGAGRPPALLVGHSLGGAAVLAALHPKSFISLDGADHLLTDRRDADYVATMIAAWSSRSLKRPTPVRSDVEPGVVTVSETGEGAFQVEVRAGGVRFLADEPPEVGGLGSGPTPYDLLAVGLGACTTMTLRMYARHKQIPLDQVSVDVGHARHKEAEPADVFTRRLRLTGNLSDQQRQRLAEIADRCPVHRTLERGAAVETVPGELMPDEAAESPGQHARDMSRHAEPA